MNLHLFLLLSTRLWKNLVYLPPPYVRKFYLLPPIFFSKWRYFFYSAFDYCKEILFIVYGSSLNSYSFSHTISSLIINKFKISPKYPCSTLTKLFLTCLIFCLNTNKGCYSTSTTQYYLTIFNKIHIFQPKLLNPNGLWYS